jgi:PPOX class probable FMN-dependent enzyme
MSSPQQNSPAIGLTEIGSSSNNRTPHLGEITSWREKITSSIARSRKIRGGNYVQLATVDPGTLEPRCRTVVFRGFLKESGKESDVLKMITDKRSCKYSEVTTYLGETQKSNCEMLWWFAKSSEQYRIRGQLKFIGAEEQDPDLSVSRNEQWGNLSDLAREQFFWKDPGVPFEEQDNVPVGGRDSDGKVLPPPDNFLLMLLYPIRCDYLRLGDNYRQIDTWNQSQGWESQRVTP